MRFSVKANFFIAALLHYCSPAFSQHNIGSSIERQGRALSTWNLGNYPLGSWHLVLSVITSGYRRHCKKTNLLCRLHADPSRFNSTIFFENFGAADSKQFGFKRSVLEAKLVLISHPNHFKYCVYFSVCSFGISTNSDL